VTEGWQADAGTSGEETAALNVVGPALKKWCQEKGNLFGVVFVIPGHDDHDVEAFATPVGHGGAETTANAPGGLVENGDAVSGEERGAVVGGGVVEAEKLIHEAGAKACGHGSELWSFIKERKDSENAVSRIERLRSGRGRGRGKRLCGVGKHSWGVGVEQSWIHEIWAVPCWWSDTRLRQGRA
jgi:hypothetical protein